MNKTEREAIFSAARDAVLAALPNAWAIYVYGSFATGDEWPQSDLDLAVLLPPEEDIPDVLELIAQVSARVAREVDIVDLRRAGDVLRREVLDRGRMIYTAEPDNVLAWEASAMTRYAHYREAIRDILEDFHRTGVGYGRE
ncbi:MAG TPA: nucleotidyltransferase domain-containing protein [Gammaproteobacteria bacterium]|nr:nucleotidyltransferase domain-containing protein [Gammaproteobacteria bacterium]